MSGQTEEKGIFLWTVCGYILPVRMEKRTAHIYLGVMQLNIGFIGAGKVGMALGLYFKRHSFPVSGYCSRTKLSAQAAAELTGSEAYETIRDLAKFSDMIFLTVTDQALVSIDSTVSALIRNQTVPGEKLWIHVSGAHSSGCLGGIRASGGAVGSMHPLQSFGTPSVSAARLEQTWFTIEGMDRAVQAIAAILEKTGGRYRLIQTENKPLYHAGACVVSNFLVTLLDSGIRFLEASGMERETIFQAIEPMIDATLANIREKGTIEALTGPIVRADYNTVQVHLQAIKTLLPSELDLYRSMALNTVRMLEGKRLSQEQAEPFRQMMEETSYGG